MKEVSSGISMCAALRLQCAIHVFRNVGRRGCAGHASRVDFITHDCLPGSLFIPYHQHSIIKKNVIRQSENVKPVKVLLNKEEAAKIIDCSRMILVRHLREIDPITFTAPHLV